VTQDVTTIAADVHGFEETVAAVLESMENIVDCDLVSVMLLAGDGLAPEATYVSVAREVSDTHYRQFLESVVGAVDQTTGGHTSVPELACLIADPHGRLGAAEVEDSPMATFLSMPLRAGGRLLGTLALSSSSPNAFGELLDSASVPSRRPPARSGIDRKVAMGASSTSAAPCLPSGSASRALASTSRPTRSPSSRNRRPPRTTKPATSTGPIW
jgi:hypothetical protein